MAGRMTVQEVSEALRAQKINPLVDTQAVRASVDVRVRALCASYPIQERCPVLDLESAYQRTLNELLNVPDLVSDGYTGIVNLRGYDNACTHPDGCRTQLQVVAWRRQLGVERVYLDARCLDGTSAVGVREVIDGASLGGP
jgi:hypothetical protein